ncbi:MAG: SRPBCC family protein [bacterium]|nr:SRPBCC family protein [bacterium]
MAAIEVTVDIPADVATVCADVERLETHIEWMADVESIEFVGNQRRGAGVVMRVLTRVGPLQTTDVIRVASWIPERSIGVRHEGLVTGAGEFQLEGKGGGARSVWREESNLAWYLGGFLGTQVAKPIPAWVWRRNLKRLRSRLVAADN